MIFKLLCREAGKKKTNSEEETKEEGLGVVEFGRALESLRTGGGGGGGEATVFRVLDVNCDGKLSFDELEAGLRPVLDARKASSNNKNLLPALVAGAAVQKHDGDGELSLSEFRSLLAAGGK